MLNFLYARELLILVSVFGVGLLGYLAGEKVKKRIIEKNPYEARRVMIEQKDERNQAVLHAAKSRAFDAVTIIMGFSILVFGLLGYLDAASLTLLIIIFITGQGILLYQLKNLQRKM